MVGLGSLTGLFPPEQPWEFRQGQSPCLAYSSPGSTTAHTTCARSQSSPAHGVWWLQDIFPHPSCQERQEQSTGHPKKASAPEGTSLPLPGAPEPGAFSRAPFRVAGWELLLFLITLFLQFESFLNGSLHLPQGFCRCPIFIVESAHQLPWERRSIKTTDLFPDHRPASRQGKCIVLVGFYF